jgi:hypothetical protein
LQRELVPDIGQFLKSTGSSTRLTTRLTTCPKTRQVKAIPVGHKSEKTGLAGQRRPVILKEKMSYKSRDRKSRLRSFRHTYGEGEYQFGDWNVEPIHQIPQPIEVGNEFDYWAINRSDCFLITFEKSIEEKIYFQRIDPRRHVYVRVQTDFTKLDESELMTLFVLISKIGIPKLSKFRHRMTFRKMG